MPCTPLPAGLTRHALEITPHFGVQLKAWGEGFSAVARLQEAAALEAAAAGGGWRTRAVVPWGQRLQLDVLLCSGGGAVSSWCVTATNATAT